MAASREDKEIVKTVKATVQQADIAWQPAAAAANDDDDDDDYDSDPPAPLFLSHDVTSVHTLVRHCMETQDNANYGLSPSTAQFHILNY